MSAVERENPATQEGFVGEPPIASEHGVGSDDSPVVTEVALTAVSGDPATALVAVVTEEEGEGAELHQTAEAVSAPVMGEAAGVQRVDVPVELLGAGVANLLAEAVEQVVKVAQGVVSGGSKPRQGGSTPPPSRASKPVPGAMAGVEAIFQRGADILSGLAGCLQESVRCMGKVIRNPSRKPCSKPAAAVQKVTQTT
ncbi:MAG: hypothetical protein HQL80_07440 [Magnetococcales bacterium]|nr:hypothetical protein [Magnetococcales bacterium]